MWKRLSPLEIEKRFQEVSTPESFGSKLQKSLKTALLIAFGGAILDTFSHMYCYGNYAGKGFRKPWYNLSDHLGDIFTAFTLLFIIVILCSIVSMVWTKWQRDQMTFICLKCQKTQSSPAMCETCKSHEILDFRFVKWVTQKTTTKTLKKGKMKGPKISTNNQP